MGVQGKVRGVLEARARGFFEDEGDYGRGKGGVRGIWGRADGSRAH